MSLLDRLGIKAEMQGKLRPMAAEDTVEVVARGEADMVVVVATRISDVAGVDFVGAIPADLQTRIGFAAGSGRFRPAARCRQGADPFSFCACSGTDLEGQGCRPDLTRNCVSTPHNLHALAYDDCCDDCGCIKQRRYVELFAVYRHRKRNNYERLK